MRIQLLIDIDPTYDDCRKALGELTLARAWQEDVVIRTSDATFHVQVLDVQEH